MKRFLRIAVCFLIAFGAWIPLSRLLANYLVVEKPLESADAIFVLSGSEAYIERAEEAAKLFKKKTAPKILLSNDGMKAGWVPKEQRNPYFAERARQALIWYGVPDEAIETLPTIVNGTNDEANLLVKICAERNLKSLLLVTSAYHSRRTLRTFERAILRSNSHLNVGIKSPSSKEQIPAAFGWWLSIKGWRTVGAEYVKIVYYWLFY